jgi:hypothetical protein
LILRLAFDGRRRPNTTPGVGRLLIRNFFSGGFVVLVKLLLSFLFFRRQVFLFFLHRLTHSWHHLRGCVLSQKNQCSSQQ